MHTTPPLTEYWMRGPVAGIPGLLQPVAHTLLQVREEVRQLMADFPEELLWKRPAGLASPAFHLQHLRGVLDRLATYARAAQLSPFQLETLEQEGRENGSLTAKTLTDNFSYQVDQMLLQLQHTDPATLEDFRGIGRKALPSTVMGLLFHAAEHSMRHAGQLLVTVQVLKDDLL